MTDSPKREDPSGSEELAASSAAQAARLPTAERRVRGRHYIDQDLTQGSIPKNLLHLAWPQALEGVFQLADQLNDLFWAGHLPSGFRAIAGLGIVQAWGIVVLTARSGLDASVRAMVARAIGAKDVGLASRVVLQAFTIGIIYSLLLILAGLFLGDRMLAIVGASSTVREMAALYVQIYFVQLALFSMRMLCSSALQASGDPLTALWATAAARIIHMALSPVLMFGWAGFPEMGLAGAAMANVVGQAVGLAMNVYALSGGKTLLRVTLRGYRVDLPLWRRMVKIGYPASISGMERGFSTLFLLRFVSPFGDVAVAAYSVVRRMEFMGQLASTGVGQATGTMVGQNLGARRPDRARRSVRWGLGYVLSGQAAICGAFILVPAVFLTLFTRNPDVVDLGSDWLRIQAFTFLLMGTGIIFQQAFQTAGDTFRPMLVIIGSVWLIEIPLSWLLVQPLGIGPLGVAYGAVAGMGVRLLFFIPYYFTNRWLTVRVL